jgi:hypothetical protein
LDILFERCHKKRRIIRIKICSQNISMASDHMEKPEIGGQIKDFCGRVDGKNLE